MIKDIYFKAQFSKIELTNELFLSLELSLRTQVVEKDKKMAATPLLLIAAFLLIRNNLLLSKRLSYCIVNQELRKNFHENRRETDRGIPF